MRVENGDHLSPNMKIFGTDYTARPCVATIGSFDGVHQGHRFVIQQVVNQAHKEGIEAIVVTFSNHPLQVIRKGFVPQMLSPEEEKITLLQQTGIDKVVMLEFTRELSLLTAHEFMRDVLKEQINVKTLFIGYDNHFGHDGKGLPDYQKYGRELGIDVMEIASFSPAEGCGVLSSTAIRNALLTGDVMTANALLGYSYFLQGYVVQGFQNGRRIGYPTANLQVSPLKLVPENGVYLVKSDMGFGMLNIGTRPTLHNGTERSIEVHLFDFHGDLYDKKMKIEILRHLRKEREFGSLEELKRQLEEDEQRCRALALSVYNSKI